MNRDGWLERYGCLAAITASIAFWVVIIALIAKVIR